ncbi:MAG: hypothetical protein ACE5G0_18580 [Rhodothermales bacterium]
MKVVPLLVCLTALAPFVLAGCSDANTAIDVPLQAASETMDQQDPSERDAVLAALQPLKQDLFREAFATLAHYHYTRYARTEQFDTELRLIASAVYITRNDVQDGMRTRAILHADSTGTSDAGALDRFVSAGFNEETVARLPDQVLPEEPAYLVPRNYEAFHYRLLPDTMLWDSATQVIEVRARPGTGQEIRQARFYLDRSSGKLVALYIERAGGGVLFREESRLFLQIRPAPDAGWVPYNIRLFTHMRAALRAPRQIRHVSTYYGYAPVGG